MKKLTVTLLMALALTGCANGRYGGLAALYDSNDYCQQNPSLSYCGAGRGTTYVTRDYRSNAPLTTTTRIQR